MMKFTRSVFMVLMLCLSLTAPDAHAGNEVEYTDINLLIDHLDQNALLDPPTTFSGIANSVWNNDPNTPSGNLVTVDYTTPPYGDPEYVFGGFSNAANASDNTVNMKSGTVTNAISGGFSVNGVTMGNTVNMNGGTVGGIYGGYSINSGAADNKVIMTGGVVNDGVFGGRSANGDGAVTGNQIEMSGGTANNLGGGWSYSGVAAGNTVIMTGGMVNSSVYGGYSNNGAVSGNTVTMTGGTVNASVYGGYSNSGNATNNTVNIYGGGFGRDAGLWGGYSGGNADAFSKNTLNLYTPATVAALGNFESYNFYLPATIKSNDAMVTVLGYSSGGNADTNINGSTISVDVATNAPVLQKDDVIHLIKVETPGHSLAGTPAAFTYNARQGLTMLYEVEPVQTSNAYSMRVLRGGLTPQTKSFSEGVAAGAAFVGQGADLLVNQGISAMQTSLASRSAMEQEGIPRLTLAAFGVMQGGKSSYTTGSSVDVTGMSLLAGVATGKGFSAGNLLLGVFVEGGFGDYNSHNSFTNLPSVDGKGDTSYVGGGIMGRFGVNSGLYSEASLRLGHTETDFGADGINNSYATYDSSGMYLGAHLGLGYVFALSQKASLDVYAKYLFTWVEGDTVQLNSGEEVDFDNVCSQRGRVGARLSYAIPQLTPYVGAAYDYEFDGDISARTRGLNIDEPSLSGGTGVFEAGFNWRPMEASSWSCDLGLEGYVGTREGISGGFKINYEF